MAVANIVVEFRNTDSIYFQDNSIVSEKFDKVLRVTFPDKSVLIFSEAENSFPESLDPESGNLGVDNSYILQDLDEWGFSMDGGIISINTENLIEDTSLNPEMYVDEYGNQASFGFESFPSGIYKFEYSFTNMKATPPPPPPVDGLITYTATEYRICTGVIDTWIVEQCSEFDNEEDSFDLNHKIRTQIEVLMLKEAGTILFDNHDYFDANKHLMAAENLCLE